MRRRASLRCRHLIHIGVKKKEPSSSIVVVSTLHPNTCSPAHRPFYFLCSLPACHWHLIVKWAKWIYQRLSLHKAFGLKRGLSLSREESNQSLCLLLSGWAIACVRTLPDPKKKSTLRLFTEAASCWCTAWDKASSGENKTVNSSANSCMFHVKVSRLSVIFQ